MLRGFFAFAKKWNNDVFRFVRIFDVRAHRKNPPRFQGLGGLCLKASGQSDGLKGSKNQQGQHDMLRMSNKYILD